ncbi:enoyl-CoA hydratase [Lentibacillus sediminis]|uniref:enoyl-CoA hydratase n=1 Tax=Lentibacillus sediminis TaxID=1940529 RepID=UPI000C1B8742|nr:enoyl-CoA hydratase [Lentibacillus sediminis]
MSKIEYESRDGISYIYLNRPERYNALDAGMLEELLANLNEAEKSEDRVIVLTGRGKAFSAGGDMAMLKEFADKDMFDEIMNTIEKITLKLYLMPKIVISAVNGSAAGLGLSLALTADYVIAEPEAKLGMLFIGIGLHPDGGGHFLLQERVGTVKAKQFIWEGTKVGGMEAKNIGIADIVAERPALEEAEKIGQKLLRSPLQAILKTKMLYHTGRQAELQATLEAEQANQWELRNTADHQEGVQAFLEKRKPVFRGE